MITSTAPAVYLRIVGSTPLYGATCDRCPHWTGQVTADLDAHKWDVWAHAATHPDPAAGARWKPGAPPYRPATRGQEVGSVPIYGVHCAECPNYQGRGSEDRDRVAQYVALHEAVHAACARLMAERSIEAVRAHQAAVQADPGRFGP
ncbi:hypothetical protein [Streptomyces silvensis]|uniref:Uncharacterized protein n=1 Tax=Streptomyces silvensis TaxID=1765722 RepID=A0A0W7XBK0_9ACTN|nr:hypothetical protein [Streptomyces silvensis]KUF20159.1 hypothetical protein AT728_40275 [Streptomyces silvensis]